MTEQLSHVCKSVTMTPCYRLQHNYPEPRKQPKLVIYSGTKNIEHFINKNKNIDLKTIPSIVIGENAAKQAKAIGIKHITIAKSDKIDHMIAEIFQLFGLSNRKLIKPSTNSQNC